MIVFVLNVESNVAFTLTISKSHYIEEKIATYLSQSMSFLL